VTVDHRAALTKMLGERTLAQTSGITIVVIPSVTTSDAELRRTPAAQNLEERLLFTVLLLRRPDVRIVYVTAVALDPQVIDYYLTLAGADASASDRLLLISLDTPGARALTYKLLANPEAVARIREVAGPADQAYLLCYKVTQAEHALSAALGLPLEGPASVHLALDSKTAARRLARRCGIPIPAGEEGLASVAEVEQSLTRLRANRIDATAAMIKLNNGFAGRGNAIIDLNQRLSPLAHSAVEFISVDETWESFAAKLSDCGAVVEEFIDRTPLVSSCAQMRIAPTGAVHVVSIYDMLLAGKRRQIYSGCRYPAADIHREVIRLAALRIAERMSADGVFGWFGLDFLVDRSGRRPSCLLNEVNLRMGGGTQPFWMALLASGASYDTQTGTIEVDGAQKAYVASDDVKSQYLVGRDPAHVIALVERRGLSFERVRGNGITLQFLGAVREHGMVGVTCIADTLPEADELYREVTQAVQDRRRS
jgi:hypothetical protein